MRYEYFRDFGSSIELELDDALYCSQPGPCEGYVRETMRLPYVREQVERLDLASIREDLRDTGAWDDEELADDEKNAVRFVWLAACQIREDAREAGDLDA